MGHFAGIAASMIIGGWAATFIASQVRYIEQVIFITFTTSVYDSCKTHLRPSLLVSMLDIDLRACGALRLVTFAGAVAF